MPQRTYGCLSIRCRHEFTTDDEPLWDQAHNIAGGPPCPNCGSRTKWIPGLTQIATAPDKPKSDFRLKNEILEKAVRDYNARQELPGLKIGDVRPERGQPTIRQNVAGGGQTIPWTFRDALGNPWHTDLPVDANKQIVQGNSWPVRADTNEKLKGASARMKKPWVPSDLTKRDK